MHSIKFWTFVSLLTLGVIFAFGWGGPAVRFPLALVLFRVAFMVTEQVWPRVRV